MGSVVHIVHLQIRITRIVGIHAKKKTSKVASMLGLVVAPGTRSHPIMEASPKHTLTNTLGRRLSTSRCRFSSTSHAYCQTVQATLFAWKYLISNFVVQLYKILESLPMLLVFFVFW